MKSTSQHAEELRTKLERGGIKGSCKTRVAVTTAGVGSIHTAMEELRRETLQHAAAAVCDGCQMDLDPIHVARLHHPSLAPLRGHRLDSGGSILCDALWLPIPPAEAA